MKTTIKITLSCFLGGVVFGLFARVLTPNFWYLGILTGAIAGYLSYEFKQVLKTIPKVFIIMIEKIFPDILLKYLKEPHPFMKSAIALIMIPICLLAQMLVTAIHKNTNNYTPTEIFIGASGEAIYLLGINLLVAIFTALIFYTLARLGSVKIDKVYWATTSDEKDFSSYLNKCRNNPNLTEKPLTLLNAWRWIFMGVIWSIRMMAVGIVWYVPKYLLIGIYKSIFFITGFIKHLFILIHSQERIICALDGTLGGTFAYLLLGPVANGLTETITFIVFGGIIGVAFGVLNYEVVSKRWLKIVPVKK